MPPTQVASLESRLCAKFTVLRDPTLRPEIRYEIVDLSNLIVEADFLRRAAALCADRIQSLCGEDRVIIYVMTIDILVVFAETLAGLGIDILCYHGALDEIEKKNVMTRWANSRVMVATSAFGAGVDNPNIRLVIHIVAAYDLISFAQETGRSGRNGQHAVSLTISSRTMRQTTLNIVTDETSAIGLNQMFDWIRNTQSCRRQMLQEFLDVDSHPCLSTVGSNACDVCQDHGGLRSLSPGAVNAFPGHRVLPCSPRIAVSIPAITAHSNASSRDTIVRTLMATLNQIGKHCIICWAYNRQFQVHSLLQCSRMIARCAKCSGGHAVNSCPFKRVPQVQGICYSCGLPQQSGVHDTTPCRGTHPAADRVWPLVWAALRSPTCSTKIQRSLGKITHTETEIHRTTEGHLN
uniref:DNA 3'-5' helicase n=3 Tax=Spongospora subterranea TaxID=70186 RepID=A0A0H5QXI3_9EUKA|eukprot:CRZ06447.1 hypothetical protein [Spongospora subterranea]